MESLVHVILWWPCSICHVVPGLSKLLLPRINPFALIGFGAAAALVVVHILIDVKWVPHPLNPTLLSQFYPSPVSYLSLQQSLCHRYLGCHLDFHDDLWHYVSHGHLLWQDPSAGIQSIFISASLPPHVHPFCITCWIFICLSRQLPPI